MTVEQRVEDNNDQFPVGMRVLAVDDDPTCLKLLETLLRKCQYHVTTTSQAVMALKLLRENKDKFDLVISDVHMPDMDGFKLLELVGLEMDLPVIMLSSYGDTKLVMKGITHGACDYLLKPVRMEELKNIWQHVIRRKKFDPKDQKNLEKHHIESGVVTERFAVTGDSDQSEKLNRKRKDQNAEEDDDEGEEDGQNEDPSTQKKPRVVWSVDLHRKFVAAVNQLGIDKAVPKRILEMMNVEKLTRENVASHLQKYRLYLKRISCVTSQQANTVAAFGGPDSTYLRTNAFSGFGNLANFLGSGHLQNAGLRNFSTGSVLGRLNAASGLGIRGLSSPRIGRLGFAQNYSNSVNNQNNFHAPLQAGDQSGNVLSSIPMSLDLDPLKHQKRVSHTVEHVNTTNESMVYPISTGFSDMKINVCRLGNSQFSVPSDPVMFEGCLVDDQRSEALQNQSSVTDASSNSKISPQLPDFSRCNDNWPSAVQSSRIQSDHFTLNDCIQGYTPSDLKSDISPTTMHMAMTSISAKLPDSGSDLQRQIAPVIHNRGQSLNFTQRQGWNDPEQDGTHKSDLIHSPINSSFSPHGVVEPYGQRFYPNSTFGHKINGLNLYERSLCVDPFPVQYDKFEDLATETTLKMKEGYLNEQKNSQGSYLPSMGSLEDLASMMVKQEQGRLLFNEENLEHHSYSDSLGGCF